MLLQPYLNFDGRCEEAVEFYKGAIGATVLMMMRFQDSPDQSMCPAAQKEKIMHAALRVGESVFMASDGQCGGAPKFNGIALSLEATSVAESEQVFAALSAGGAVTMPMMETFFSKRFGMCSDKFGVGWMITVKPA